MAIDASVNAKQNKNSQLGCFTDLSAALQTDDKVKFTLATIAFVHMKKCNNSLPDSIPILSAAFQHDGFEFFLGHAL